MIELNVDELKLIKFHQLYSIQGLEHAVTTRQGGCSTGDYESLNLALNTGDDPDRVYNNRLKLARFLQISVNAFFFPDQSHTSNIIEIKENTTTDDLSNADALVTKLQNRCLAVCTADCVPILLYDTKQKAIAAIHAGWKGTAQEIVSKTITYMKECFDSRPSDILACIGPSISWRNYEVGPEVTEQFISIFGDNSKIIRTNARSGVDNIDLCEANKHLLIESGVFEKHIETIDVCTYKNPGLFFSARRDGIKSGRFASYIMLNS